MSDQARKNAGAASQHDERLFDKPKAPYTTRLDTSHPIGETSKKGRGDRITKVTLYKRTCPYCRHVFSATPSQKFCCTDCKRLSHNKSKTRQGARMRLVRAWNRRDVRLRFPPQEVQQRFYRQCSLSTGVGGPLLLGRAPDGTMTPCLIWTGTRLRPKYKKKPSGQIAKASSLTSCGTFYYAGTLRRPMAVAYLWTVGFPARGNRVIAACGTRGCCNPDHARESPSRKPVTFEKHLASWGRWDISGGLEDLRNPSRAGVVDSDMRLVAQTEELDL